MKKTKMHSLIGLVAVGMLALSGCGASNSGGGSDDNGGSSSDSGSNASFMKKYGKCDVTAHTKDVSSKKGTADDKKKDITIGAFNGWPESFATSYLLQNVLEKRGYDVSVKGYDAAALFTGLAKGQIDFTTDVWLPTTHAKYVKQYGDKMEDLGCWYDNAKLAIAVNKKSPAKTIGDLKKMSSQYDNRIVGIEPGAGETGVVKDKTIPEYGLQKLKFITSSSPAMLSEIKKTQQDGKNIAVTLWHPHWAYKAYPMRDLKDPKGAMGGAEYIHAFARADLSKDDPQLAQLVRNFVFPDSKLNTLENLMYGPKNANSNENKFPAMVKKWLSSNPDFANQLASGSLK